MATQLRAAVLLLVIGTIVGLTIAGDYDYGEVLGKSILFYEAQRTGRLPSTNRIPWRGDSFVTDRGVNGEDLSGGYFDAGDFVKFGLPFSASMTILAWGMVDHQDGYEKAGEWRNALETLRWGTDYMIKTHPSANEIYVQVGDGREDHAFWGRPEDWTGSNPRPVLLATTSKPASEVAAETAATLAAASMVFRAGGDPNYAASLLTHARQLYTYANTYRGKYSDSFPEVAEFYNSWSGYGDELTWAAAWMYRATSESAYKQDYERFWSEFGMSGRPSEASWDSKQAFLQVLLAKIDGGSQYVNSAKTFCDWIVNQAPKTPKGLVWLSEWGSLRHASNVVFACLQAASAGISPAQYRQFAKTQIDYILGDSGRSFVVGYGNNPPQRPHHAGSSCPNRPAPCSWNDFSSPNPNPQVLHGALVGGPDLQDRYVDNREDYVANEVTIDYNAGFQSALAGLCSLHC
jgi:hypothetical protein